MYHEYLFSILTKFKKDFDRKIMKILPNYSSTFNRMGIDVVPPPKFISAIRRLAILLQLLRLCFSICVFPRETPSALSFVRCMEIGGGSQWRKMGFFPICLPDSPYNKFPIFPHFPPIVYGIFVKNWTIKMHRMLIKKTLYVKANKILEKMGNFPFFHPIPHKKVSPFFAIAPPPPPPPPDWE